jgi:hypothetical protein
MQIYHFYKLFFVSLFFCFLNSHATFAQQETPTNTIYYIQLGLLRYPDTLQFATLNNIGKIYQETDGNQLTRILLGKYSSKTQATDLLKEVKTKGFEGFIVTRAENTPSNSPDEKPMVSTIYAVQLGAFKDQIPSTAKIEKYGKIFSVVESGYTKLRIGYFSKEEDALAILNRVKAYGFPKAGLYVLHNPPSAGGRNEFIPQTEALAFQSASFYKRMQGKINGSQLVVVHLYYSENSFHGYYTDPTTAERKHFTYYGVNLNDKSQNKQKDVYITRFGNDSFGLSFGIKDKQTGKEDVFSLTEQYQRGAAHFDVVTVYRKKIKKLANGEIGADVFVEYPVMADYTDKQVEKKFNAVALQFSATTKAEQNMNAKIDNQLLADLSKIYKYFPQYNWISETYENKIIENSNYLLSIRYQVENILAVPKITIKHKSFNLKTGQEITAQELFTANSQKELQRLIETKLKTKYPKTKFTTTNLTATSTKMLQNFYATSYGVVFFYDKGDGLPQSSLEIAIPYKEMKNSVNPAFLKEFGLK